jgi:hypothetical protein
MIRTQVYLTEEQSKDIKQRALLEKRREADVIRELLDRGRRISQNSQYKTAGDALLALAKLGKKTRATGPTDLSTNHNEYLYGNKQ